MTVQHDPQPADPLVLRRKSGVPLWSGWFAIGMAALSVGYRQLHYSIDPNEKLVLALSAAILGLGGGIMLTWRHPQQISVSLRDRKITIEDGPPFFRSREMVYFRTIRTVEVESDTDPHPHDSPPSSESYRVVVCLLDGRRLPLSDYSGEEAAVRLCEELRPLLRGDPA